MISCTEFIPAYSELFKYIEEIDSYEAVKAYWDYIAKYGTNNILETLVREHGVEGCWLYWSKTLTEEACDCRIEYDEDADVYSLDMRRCPSKGHLLDYPHITPYHDYCGHCAALYAPILKKLGLSAEEHYEHVDEARCSSRYWIEKK